jgi:hypothetical protein
MTWIIKTSQLDRNNKINKTYLRLPHKIILIKILILVKRETKK